MHVGAHPWVRTPFDRGFRTVSAPGAVRRLEDTQRHARIRSVSDKAGVVGALVARRRLFGAQQPLVDQDLELLGHMRLQHLRPIGADAEAHAVFDEAPQDVPHLLEVRHGVGLEVGRGADFQDYPLLRQLVHQLLVAGRQDAVAYARRAQVLQHLPHLPRIALFAAVDGDAQPSPPAGIDGAAVVAVTEVWMPGSGNVDADDSAGAIGDGLASDDFVQLHAEGAIQHEDQPASHGRILQLGSLHAADRARNDVVEVALAAAVALHRIEAQLHGGDVALAVAAADDLVHAVLDRFGTGLDELGPVEQGRIVVEVLD